MGNKIFKNSEDIDENYTDSDYYKLASNSDPNLVHVYKTLEVIEIIDNIKQNINTDIDIDISKRLEQFLDIVPRSSNYLIQWDLNYSKQLTAKIIDVYSRQAHSSTKMRDHIKIHKLTNKCKIGLSPLQKKQFDELIEENKKIEINCK